MTRSGHFLFWWESACTNRAENVSESSVYRHLKLAYMNPHTINDIMSGKLQCSVDKLFNMA